LSEIHWVKLSTEMFDDEKIKAIRSMPSGDSVCLIWIKLITLAGKTNDHGQIYLSEDIPYTDTLLANSIGHPIEVVRLALSTFKRMGMIEILSNDRIALVNWEKYQNIEGMERVRQLAKERTRKYRERLLLTCDVTVTPRDALDSELDSDSDIDKKTSTSSSPTSIPKSDPKPKLFYSFDESVWYGISDEQVKLWAEAYPAVDIDLELRQMGEWCKSNGARGHKQDWRKFIVNWLKRSQDRGGSEPKGGSTWKSKKYSR
jgi:predicted phage replisome organizer